MPGLCVPCSVLKTWTAWKTHFSVSLERFLQIKHINKSTYITMISCFATGKPGSVSSRKLFCSQQWISIFFFPRNSHCSHQGNPILQEWEKRGGSLWVACVFKNPYISFLTLCVIIEINIITHHEKVSCRWVLVKMDALCTGTTLSFIFPRPGTRHDPCCWRTDGKSTGRHCYPQAYFLFCCSYWPGAVT